VRGVCRVVELARAKAWVHPGDAQLASTRSVNVEWLQQVQRAALTFFFQAHLLFLHHLVTGVTGVTSRKEEGSR
jgi:hypothetical protein